jgi:hypothetical protein
MESFMKAKLLLVIMTVFSGAVSALAQEAVRTGEKTPEQAVKEPALRDELIRRVKEEDDIRQEFAAYARAHGFDGPDYHEKERQYPELAKEWTAIASRMGEIDRANTARMKEVVSKYGWPGKSLVGTEAAGAAWQIVQHSDNDVAFQRQCLDLITKLPPGEVSNRHLAYLTDRVLLNEGKKQLYGTMLRRDESGNFVPKPTEDEANVDKRRAALGLEPLRDYIQKQSRELLKKP